MLLNNLFKRSVLWLLSALEVAKLERLDLQNDNYEKTYLAFYRAWSLLVGHYASIYLHRLRDPRLGFFFLESTRLPLP